MAGAVFDLILHAARAICGTTAHGDDPGEAAVDVGVFDGRIAAIQPYGTLTGAGGRSRTELTLDPGLVLLPGLVDSHVHIGEPGHTDWEGFSAATRGAAAGGITTLVDMPLDSVPVTTSVAALAAKRAAAQGKCLVNVEFWGGVVPGNLDRLPELHAAGVRGFKCFLAESGSPDFPPLTARQLEAAMTVASALRAPLLVHAESNLDLARSPAASGRDYRNFLASRPEVAELSAVRLVIDTARRTGARVHIVHLSSAGALPLLAEARRDGVAVTVETCPHYLTLAAEEISDGATEYAVCPPIRDRRNAEDLWAGLDRGEIDLIASDHSPCAAELKHLDSGDFGRAWGGISSLQWSLPIMWTATQQRGSTLSRLMDWMALKPAELAGLAAKGRIAVGADADLVAFDPTASTIADPTSWEHPQQITPYAGRRLSGAVTRTWVAGRTVWPPRSGCGANDRAGAVVAVGTGGPDLGAADAHSRR